MSEVTQESTSKSKVTAPMMEAALNTLKQWNVKNMSRKIDNNDLLFEILDGALKASSASLSDSHIKTESDWRDFFSRCLVIVTDPLIGQQLFRKGLESVEGFQKLVETIAKNGNIIIPLSVYPGIALFTDVLNPLEEKPKTPKGKANGKE